MAYYHSNQNQYQYQQGPYFQSTPSFHPSGPPPPPYWGNQQWQSQQDIPLPGYHKPTFVESVLSRPAAYQPVPQQHEQHHANPVKQESRKCLDITTALLFFGVWTF